jgi:hypothetical protein
MGNASRWAMLFDDGQCFTMGNTVKKGNVQGLTGKVVFIASYM